MSFAKRKEKRRRRLILNLGSPLDDSRYFRRLEAAKKVGNPFEATIVSGGRERERKMNNKNLTSINEKKKKPQKPTVLSRLKKETMENKELNSKDKKKKCGTPTKKSGEKKNAKY